MSVPAPMPPCHAQRLSVQPFPQVLPGRRIGTCVQRVLHRAHGDGPWACHYCARTIVCGDYPESPDFPRATVDHVVPVIRGGSNRPHNTVPACGSCNSAKGMALYPTEWTPGTGLDVATIGMTPPLDPGGALSARAAGVLAFIVERPDVPVTPRDLSPHFTEGRDAIRSAIGELVRTGRLAVSVRRERNMIRWTLAVTG